MIAGKGSLTQLLFIHCSGKKKHAGVNFFIPGYFFNWYILHGLSTSRNKSISLIRADAPL